MISVDTSKLINYIAFKLNPRYFNEFETNQRDKRNLLKRFLQITRFSPSHYADKRNKFFRTKSFNHIKIIQRHLEPKKNNNIKLDLIIRKKKQQHITNNNNKNVFSLNITSNPCNYSQEIIRDNIHFKLKEKSNTKQDESPNKQSRAGRNSNNTESVKLNSVDKVKQLLPQIIKPKNTISIINKQQTENQKLKHSISSADCKISNANNNNTKNIIQSSYIKKRKTEPQHPPLALLDNNIRYNTLKEHIKHYHNYNPLTLPIAIKKPSCVYLSSPSITSTSSPTQPPIYNYTINRFYRDQFPEYFTHRTNWKLVSADMDGSINIHFQWKYYAHHANISKCRYEPVFPRKKLRMINLFEHNYELGNKKNLFLNLIKYCEKINVNVFDLIPFTIILSNNKNFEIGSKGFHEIFSFLNENYNKYSIIQKEKFILNRLYKHQFHYDPNFINCNRTYINFPLSFTSNKNYWIVKPVDLYQGKCIEISNNYQDIIRICQKVFKGVDRFTKSSSNNGTSPDSEEENEVNEDSAKKKRNCARMYCSNDIVLQKYLDNPLLYHKRKFDIRCYVLVDHNLNVFYCREGHLKGSSEIYDINVTDKFVHITNHSLQKMSENFEKFECGNEMSYQDFKNYLQSEGITLDKFDMLVQQMKYLIEVSMNAVGKKLLNNEKVLCFEIFGYDFIVDNMFKPWILEINSNPGLGISSPVIAKLVPRMIDDAFRLTIDKVFETVYDDTVIDKESKLYKSKYALDGFSDDENIFEFICNIMNK